MLRMPKECSNACDSFNEAKRASHRFGPRSTEKSVSMGDAKLTSIFNPQAKEGGVHMTNEYPRVPSNFK